METQECVNASQVSIKKASVKAVDDCPTFIVTWINDSTNSNYSINIKIKKTTLKNYLKMYIQACEIDNIRYKVQMINDEFICDLKNINNSTALQINKNNTMSIVYFSMVLNNNISLKFNDEQDHYIINNDLSCPNTNCTIGFWKDEHLRYYCKWCMNIQNCSGIQQRNNCNIWNATNNQKIIDVSNVEIQSPNVTIVSFKPHVSTLTSKTTMNITIRNHNILVENKTMVVTVAGRNCENPVTVDDDGMITCTIPKEKNISVVNGLIQVVYVSTMNYTLNSLETFDFVNPAITNISLNCGPISGGTLINMSGEFLNATKDIKVVFDDGIPCNITNEPESNRIACLTGAIGKPTAVRMKLVVDGIETELKTLFNYVTEPTIGMGQQLAGIQSGGIQLPVLGNFSCIQRTPKMCVDYDGTETYFGDCKVINDTKMICLTPNFKDLDILPTQPLPVTFQVDFAGKNMSLSPTDTKYLLHPDPTYDNFEVTNNTFTIYGNFSYTSYELDDFIVRLQNSSDTCNVSTVDKINIICHVTSSSLSTENIQKITVEVGQHLNNTVGKSSQTTSNLVSVLSGFSFVSVFIMLVFGLLFFLKTILNNSENRTNKRYIEELQNITAGIEERKY